MPRKIEGKPVHVKREVSPYLQPLFMYPDNGFLIVVSGANFSYYFSTRKGGKANGANIYTLLFGQANAMYFR